MNFALFLPNWVGDLVMATPTLRALRRHFGRSTRIVGILRPNLAELLAGTDWLDEQWYFAPRRFRFDLGRWALVARMRRMRPDMALLLTNSLHTAALAWLGGAKDRIGYVRDARGPLLTGKLYPLRDGRRPRPVPMVDYYLALARAAGCPPESPRLELAVTEAEHQRGERIWKTLGLRTDGRVVAINSSGAYGAAKLWPIEHCGTLARQIVAQLDCDVLLLCGPRERQAALDAVRHAGSPRVFTLPEDAVGLSSTKACLERSRLLVSTDSGPRHIAAALGKPVITLLGPTLPTWIENPTVSGRMLRAEVDCLGCGRRICPLEHHGCMRNLGPEQVFREVAAMVDAPAVKAA
ncbi:MAG: lipopolysaccharide heptosyltransferase II [Thermoguttaceae bacterium]|jgi:heptosyltransferase-2